MPSTKLALFFCLLVPVLASDVVTPQPAHILVSQLPAAAGSSGSMYVVTDGTTGFDCSTGGGIHYVVCLSNGSAWVPVPGPSSPGTLTYYWTNTASDIATYLQQTSLPFAPVTNVTLAAGAGNGTVTLQNWATNAGFPGLTFIPAGVFTFHFHASRSNPGSGTIRLQIQLWETTAAGVDVGQIGTTTELTAALTGAEVEYTVSFVTGATYTMAASTSRIAARVQAVKSGGPVASNVVIRVGGEADSRTSLPSNTVDATFFVPYTGATQDVALGTHNLTGTTVTGATLYASTTVAAGTANRTGNTTSDKLETLWGGDVSVADPATLGSESLTNGALTAGTSWARTGDFALAGDAAVYTDNTHAGTLTQTNANLTIAAANSNWYVLTYTLSALTPGTLACSVTSGIGDTTLGLALDMTAGVAKKLYFRTKSTASSGSFVISCTSTAGGAFTLDDLSLKQVIGGYAIGYGGVRVPRVPSTVLGTDSAGNIIDASMDLNYTFLRDDFCGVPANNLAAGDLGWEFAQNLGASGSTFWGTSPLAIASSSYPCWNYVESGNVAADWAWLALAGQNIPLNEIGKVSFKYVFYMPDITRVLFLIGFRDQSAGWPPPEGLGAKYNDRGEVMAGTVTCTGNTTVTGALTTFNDGSIAAGDIFHTGAQNLTIQSISDATHLTTTANCAVTAGASWSYTDASWKLCGYKSAGAAITCVATGVAAATNQVYTLYGRPSPVPSNTRITLGLKPFSGVEGTNTNMSLIGDTNPVSPVLYVLIGENVHKYIYVDAFRFLVSSTGR